MSKVPADWEIRPLATVADVRLGRQRSPKNHTGTHMRPYLRAANVDWTGLKLDDIKKMNFTDDEMKIYRLERGDVLIGEASGSPGEVGKSAVWNDEVSDCAFQNTLLRVRSHAPEPRYLLHWFQHLARSGQFAAQSRGVGIHHLGRAKLAAWPVPLPPIDEQQRIVDIIEEHLSRLDAASALLGSVTRRVSNLEASVLTNQYDRDCLTPLGDVAEIQGGIQKQPKRAAHTNAFPFLRVANVTARGLDLDDVHRIELFNGELNRYALQAGDLLVVEGNGSPSQIGRAALWDGSIENCVHQNHLIRVRPSSELLSEYLELAWNTPENRRQLTSLSSSTSGLHTLSVSKLKSLKVPVPSREFQVEAADRVATMRDHGARLRSAVKHAAARSLQLRRAALQAAFSGRLTGSCVDTEIVEELAASTSP